MKRVFVPVLAAAAVLVGVLAPAAGAADAEQHCFVRVIDRKADGELVTTAPKCYATAAARDRGILASAPTKQARGVRAQSTFTLATHFSGTYGSGTSTAIVGSDCAGGYLNTSQWWHDNMSSTYPGGCTRIRHYSGAGMTGGWQDITSTSAPNLSLHPGSVQYAT